MKPWQKGYALPLLKSITKEFTEGKKQFTFGAFGVINEAGVADAMSKGRITVHNYKDSRAVFWFREIGKAETGTDFTGSDYTLVPSLYIYAVGGDLAAVKNFLSNATAHTIYVQAFQEDKATIEALLSCGLELKAVKIKASSDMVGVYGWRGTQQPRVAYSRAETLALALLCPVSEKVLLAVSDELSKYLKANKAWEQHYSNYNKRDTWTAFSLRGYSEDPGFIIKPGEMNKKWKAENASMVAAKLTDTTAAPYFAGTMKAVSRMFEGELQRVRFMALAPKNGELTRHADITDREAGVAEGYVARFHMPIETNPKCLFTAWDLHGSTLRLNMKRGFMYYLDQRKPHTVVNGGEGLRIHLVIDVKISKAERQLLEKARVVSTAANN